MNGDVDPMSLFAADAIADDGRSLLAAAILRGDTVPAQSVRLRLGVVTAVASAAWTISVRISGATTAVAGIPVAAANLPVPGQTVVLLQTAGAYVMLGVLGGPTIQAANQVVNTDASGYGTFVFPRPYPAGASPVVNVTGGNNEIATIDPGTVPSNTGFRALFRNINGTAIASGPVRAYWTATLPTA